MDDPADVRAVSTDMTILNMDPVTCGPNDLLTARVTTTVINGEVVWRAK